jgi:hypothetical protein
MRLREYLLDIYLCIFDKLWSEQFFFFEGKQLALSAARQAAYRTRPTRMTAWAKGTDLPPDRPSGLEYPAESHGCRDADGSGQPNATATSPGQTCPLRRPSAPCREARVSCLDRRVPRPVNNNQPHAGTDSGAVFVPCRPPPSTTPPREGMVASTACSLLHGLSLRLSRSYNSRFLRLSALSRTGLGPACFSSSGSGSPSG